MRVIEAIASESSNDAFFKMDATIGPLMLLKNECISPLFFIQKQYKTDMKISGGLLLFLEVLWIIVYAVFTFIFQLDPAEEHARTGLILLALHAGAPLALIVGLEKLSHNERLPIVHLCWILFSLVTDIGSVLDAFLHISGDSLHVHALRAMAVTATVLSGLVSLWYFSAWRQPLLLKHQRRRQV